ncbi:glycoside hydrolase family 108 protein [Spirosoma panaciterrae]|uniref:glycoside hydrolase family 108 protein n=1 Tax=Spirosoma panaciterrae TaxID=496058 RepID=UPI00035FEA82|nr:glycosyl hydrolase 108 family protein [Spirosoma panaciterrae]
MAAFDKAYSLTLKIEAGYANDPDDPGGETFGGISRIANSDWPGWVLIDQIKKTAKRTDYDKVMFAHAELMRLVRSVYKARYWDVNRLDFITNQAIANELFDTSVNMGITVGAQFLQRALNVLNQNQQLYPDIAVDGVVGPQTVMLTNAHPYPALILKVLNILQGYRYIDLAEKAPVQEKYMRGWLSRVAIQN